MNLTENQTEPKKEEKKQGLSLDIGGTKIDVANMLPAISKIYVQWKWVAPLVGFDIPPQVDEALTTLAQGGKLTPEQISGFKTMSETMERGVGEPVLTKQLAEDAYLMHKDGMGTREIAEQFTKDGSPCSHSTIARWINIVDAEKRFSRIAKIIRIGKIAGFIGLMALMFVIGKFLF